jgi:hypothetical protein
LSPSYAENCGSGMKEKLFLFCFHGVDMRLVVERDKLREQERKRWVGVGFLL